MARTCLFVWPPSLTLDHERHEWNFWFLEPSILRQKNGLPGTRGDRPCSEPGPQQTSSEDQLLRRLYFLSYVLGSHSWVSGVLNLVPSWPGRLHLQPLLSVGCLAIEMFAHTKVWNPANSSGLCHHLQPRGETLLSLQLRVTGLEFL